MEGSYRTSCSKNVCHLDTGEGHLIRQTEKTTKLHATFDTLDGVHVQVDKSLVLKEESILLLTMTLTTTLSS